MRFSPSFSIKVVTHHLGFEVRVLGFGIGFKVKCLGKTHFGRGGGMKEEEVSWEVLGLVNSHNLCLRESMSVCVRERLKARTRNGTRETGSANERARQTDRPTKKQTNSKTTK